MTLKIPFAAALAALALAVVPGRADAESYLVLKLGYYGPSGEIAYAQATGTSLDPKFHWAAGVGTNLTFLGLELTAGYLSTHNALVDARSVPVVVTAKLRLPFPIISPYVEVGGGPYFNTVEPNPTIGLPPQSHTTFGLHAGGGVDLNISSLLLGVEARYVYVDSGFEDAVSGYRLRLDGVTVTANLGFYF